MRRFENVFDVDDCHHWFVDVVINDGVHGYSDGVSRENLNTMGWFSFTGFVCSPEPNWLLMYIESERANIFKIDIIIIIAIIINLFIGNSQKLCLDYM